MNKTSLTEKDIEMKQRRIAQWEKFHTLPKITQTVRVANSRTAAPGLGGE